MGDFRTVAGGASPQLPVHFMTRHLWSVVTYHRIPNSTGKKVPLFADAAFAGADELNEVLYFRQRRQFLFNLRQRVGDGQTFAEQDLVSLLQGILRVIRDALAFHADLVNGARFRGIAVGNHEWRHILHDFGTAADHRQFADAAELMDRRDADDRMIFHRDVAGQGCAVRHDDVAADDAIVRDVTVGQNVIMRTDARRVAVTGGAVNGDVFAQRVMVADFGAGDAALPFQILRLQSDAGERKNFISFPQPGVPVNDHVRMQPAIVAERDVLADDAIRPDFTTGTDLRLGVNDGGGMNHWPRKMKVTSASLTTSSRTLQTPLALPILPRDLVSSTSMISTSPGTTGLRHFTSSAAMK